MGPNLARWLDDFRRNYGSDSPAYVASMLEARACLRRSFEEAVRRDEEGR